MPWARGRRRPQAGTRCGGPALPSPPEKDDAAAQEQDEGSGSSARPRYDGNGQGACWSQRG
eukprot:scaffold269831_cov27-Tisochrysis_lutea.AAC.1